ncbi:hypothetical protein CR161_09415 [Prosthecochloris sp. ZM]|nr:hypothetical protein CR161_09415 [Prosthecochloris sp. ZM]
MANNNSHTFNSHNIRTMAARWIIMGTMRLESAAHFGGEGEGFANMKILRDPKNGGPLLPGTSLTGALRSHLADILFGYRADEQQEVSRLFGSVRSHDDGSQSPLIVFDSFGKLPDGLDVEIRDGVAIDSKTGTAEPNHKFDVEVLPAGIVFPVRFELIVEQSKDESELLMLLAKTLEGLSNGDISLGMRRSRGLGAVNAYQWRARRFDLDTQEGWIQWVTSDHDNPIASDVPYYDSPFQAIQTVYHELPQDGERVDRRKRVVIEADLAIQGGLLVRSPGTDAVAPDVIHLHSAERPVLPGTSLAGAMRAHALRISQCVRREDACEWIDRLFGPRIEKKMVSHSKQPSASRLRISESSIENPAFRLQTRIAIDRFTGGTVTGALFEEQLLAGGTFTVRFELRNPLEGEVGLLLLLLRDLLSGEIPVGGSASVGRGMLRGKATLYLANGEAYVIQPDQEVDEKVENAFNGYIKAFIDAASLHVQEVCS